MATNNPLAAALAPQQPQAVQAPAPQAQPQAVPPASPQALAQRKSGFRDFFAALKQDPNVQNALIQFGTGVLAGPKRGQSEGSLLANNLQNSLSSLQQSRNDDITRKQAAEDRRLATEQKAATTAGVQATTGKTVAETGQVATNAQSTRALQAAQAEGQLAGAADTSAQTAGKVAERAAETGATAAGVGVSQQNANTNTTNAETLRLQLDATTKLNNDELTFKYAKLTSAENIAFRNAKASGSLPSSDIQGINNELAILGVTREQATPEQIKKATRAFRRFAIGIAIGGNLGLASFSGTPEAAGSFVSNVNQALGLTEPIPVELPSQAMQDFVKTTFGADATLEQASPGTFNIIVDSKVVDTVTARN